MNGTTPFDVLVHSPKRMHDTIWLTFVHYLLSHTHSNSNRPYTSINQSMSWNTFFSDFKFHSDRKEFQHPIMHKQCLKGNVRQLVNYWVITCSASHSLACNPLQPVSLVMLGRFVHMSYQASTHATDRKSCALSSCVQSLLSRLIFKFVTLQPFSFARLYGKHAT